MAHQRDTRYDAGYTAQEDRLMQDTDLQKSDFVPEYRADESSYYRTTGLYRPMEGNMGSFGESGFYRPPGFETEDRLDFAHSYDDLREEAYSRIFSSSDQRREDRWGMYDFPATQERPVQEDTSYFSDYFSSAQVSSAPSMMEDVPKQEDHADMRDASFLQAYDTDMRYDASDDLRYDDPNTAEQLPASRTRRTKSSGKKIKIIILCIVFALAAITLGVFLVDRLVTPMMEFDMEDVVQEGEVSPDSIPSAQVTPETAPVQQADTPSSTQTQSVVQDVVQQAFTIDAWSVYLVQAGAFSDPNNADNFAQSMRQSGGAGYIIDSEYHRVMTTAFNNEYDAGQMRDTLTAQSASAQVYELSFSQMDFTVSAAQSDVDVITAALSQWPELIKSLMTVIRRMESGEITSQEAIVSIKEIYAQLASSRDALAFVSGAKNSVLVRDLSNMYTEAARILLDVLDGGVVEKGPTLARVKYAHIGMCWNYRTLVEGIAEGATQAVEQTESTEE